jgi:hypothetical protein
MPESDGRRTPLTKDQLIARVKACTLKIGIAKRMHDAATTSALRDRRALAMRKLAERHDVWTLVNADGHSEFVDRPEWEQRMVAWARRTGQIPRGVIRMERLDTSGPSDAPGA